MLPCSPEEIRRIYIRKSGRLRALRVPGGETEALERLSVVEIAFILHDVLLCDYDCVSLLETDTAWQSYGRDDLPSNANYKISAIQSSKWVPPEIDQLDIQPGLTNWLLLALRGLTP